MKRINVLIQDETHKFLFNYKLDNNLTKIGQAIDEIVKYLNEKTQLNGGIR